MEIVEYWPFVVVPKKNGMHEWWRRPATIYGVVSVSISNAFPSRIGMQQEEEKKRWDLCIKY